MPTYYTVCSCLFSCFLLSDESKPFHFVVHVFCPQCCMVPLPCWCMTCCVQKTSSQYPTAHPPKKKKSHFFIALLSTPSSSSLRLSLFFYPLIIPYICSPRRPACSMTTGRSPWRTNHAFHSGSKREVSCFFCGFSFFVCFCLSVRILHAMAC